MDTGAIAVVTRGAGVDAVHSATVAAVDAEGYVTHAAGDPETPVFTRSSIKPFQALALIRSGAVERFGIGPQEIAVACASHSGTDAHVAVVRRLLTSAAALAEHVGCGAHWPIGLRLLGEYPVRGEASDPLRHNCSGKHAGFLAVARALGHPIQHYLEAGAPVEQLVRDCVAEACELPAASLIAGTDGCSAQNYAMPLSALARGAKNLASAKYSGVTGVGLSHIRAAMQDHPWLVSGVGRFDFELSSAFPNNVVIKSGAEAIQLMGFSDPPIGIAVKVLDGAERALAPIALAVLRELGRLPPEDMRLQHWERPPVTNAKGTRTGEIVAHVRLRTLSQATAE